MESLILVAVLLPLSAAAIIIAAVPTTTIGSVNASFCIFNCDAVNLEKRLAANADCFKDQIQLGVTHRTAYDTEDLSADGKILTISGVKYTEEELRNEWKENPDRHSSNCYFIADITPQEVEKVYRESLK